MTRAEQVEMLWGDPMVVASRALRSVVTAAPGKILYVGDFKSVEAVGLAWLAGHQTKINNFLAGKKLYELAAAGITGDDAWSRKLDYSKISKGIV